MPDTIDAGTALEQFWRFLGDYGLGLAVLVLLVGGLVYFLILSGRTRKDGTRQTPILIPGSELDAFREQARLTEERIRQDAANAVSKAEQERIDERRRREDSDAKLDKALDLLERMTDQLVELRIDVARNSSRRRVRPTDDKQA